MRKIKDMCDRNNRGVSPVIAVILLVALSVILATVLAFSVFSITGNDVSKPAQSSIDTSLNDGLISVNVIRNSNVDRVFVRDPENSIIDSINVSGGESGVFESVPTGGGDYEVVAEVDGDKQVIRIYEVAAVRIDMTLGGEITVDANFKITHEGGDNISAKNMRVFIDAEDACGESSKLVNLPVEGGDPRPEGDFTIGPPIIDNDFNTVTGTINNETDNKYSEGDSFGFIVAESDCDMTVGDKITISVVDNKDQPVIVGRGNYTVVSSSGN